MFNSKQSMTKKEFSVLVYMYARDSESRLHHAELVQESLAERGIYTSGALIMHAMTQLYPVDLSAMLRLEELEMYISDKTGNSLFLYDPERAERIYEAAEHGEDGSTHAETIQDWREYLSITDYPDWAKDRLLREIDEVELWHELNGSLDSVP